MFVSLRLSLSCVIEPDPPPPTPPLPALTSGGLSERLRYLLVAADAAPDALQLCVADLPELELGHGHHPLALRDELAAVADKEAVVTGERLQDLRQRQTENR